MALIFPDNRGNSPSTHVLIIGVGGYRHLQGGTTPSQEVVDKVGVLGQLTSPPCSVIAFAQHLLSSHADLRSPLGSIDLLISPTPNDSQPFPVGINVGPATLNDIQTSYGVWRKRCNRHKDNIAIFYFCGHGLEKEEQFLLAEDFGANPNNPWLGAFSFTSTRLAFHGCLAETQCFFIDACRNITSAMLKSRPDAQGLETVMEGFRNAVLT